MNSRTALCLMLLLPCAWLMGQDTFSAEEILSPRIALPSAVATADFDGDGDMDIACAAADGDLIAVYEQIGQGRFVFRAVANAGTPTRLEAVDVNSDGHADLLFCTSWGRLIGWFPGNGDGTFADLQEIDRNMGQATEMTVADFNSDGSPDLAVFLDDVNQLVVYLSSGPGEYGEAAVINSDCDLNDLTSADLDNDGDADLMTGGYSDDNLGWYANQGDGSFSGYVPVANSLGTVSAIETLDADGDNDMDCLAIDRNDTSLHLFTNQGNGTFSSGTQISREPDIVWELCSIDLNDDQHIDVMTGDGLGFISNGDGSFDNAAQWGIEYGLYSDMKAADIDGDGDEDLVTSEKDCHSVIWWENRGSGMSAIPHYMSYGGLSNEFLYTGDFNNDGLTDVFQCVDSQLLFYANAGNDIFALESPVSLGSSYSAAVLANVTGSDAPELVLAMEYSQTLTYQTLEMALYGAAPITLCTCPDRVSSMQFVDIDNDGDEDIVTVSRRNNSIHVILQQSEGQYAEPVLISDTHYNSSTVLVTDLTGDGFADIIASSWSDFKISWFQNDGSGHFADEIILETPDWCPETMDCADLDGDGYQDVAAAMSTEGYVRIYFAPGAETGYAGQKVEDIINSDEYIRLEDIDLDGVTDLLSASNNARFKWYKNDGAGQFTRQESCYATGDFLNGMSLEDFDNDGDADLMLMYDENISYFANSTVNTAVEETAGQPQSCMLHSNYPNPFNPSTTIAYELPAVVNVTLDVYDVTGRLVRTLLSEQQPAGTHRAVFNAGGLPSGVYIIKLQAGDAVLTRKMVLTK